MTNSRTKGKNGELEFSRELEKHIGVRLIRNLQQSRDGGYDLVVDVDAPCKSTITGYAIEVKRYAKVKQSDISRFWRQAVYQAPANKTPMLAYRADRCPWRIVLPLYAVSQDFDYEHDHTAEVSLEGFAKILAKKNPGD